MHILLNNVLRAGGARIWKARAFRCLLTLSGVVLVWGCAPANAASQQEQATGALLHAIMLREDLRSRDSATVALFARGIDHVDPMVRTVAVRAIGRSNVAELAPHLLRLLRDPAPGVRVESAFALSSVAAATPPSASGSAALLALWSDSLAAAATREEEAGVAALLLRALSRVPASEPSRVLRSYELAASRFAAADAETLTNLILVVERLARTQGRVVPLPDGVAGALRGIAGSAATSAQARRLAYMSLANAVGLDGTLVRRAVLDSDEQIRRIGMSAALALDDSSARREILDRLLDDPSVIVRVEVARTWGRRGTPDEGCEVLARLLRDSAPLVVAAAAGTLPQSGARCSDAQRESFLLQLTADAVALTHPPSRADSPAGRDLVHRGVHALQALARMAPDRLPVASAVASHPSWVVRMYAARALGTTGDLSALQSLQRDSDPNVRIAALDGISRLAARGGDDGYIRALSDPHYNVVMVAAGALRGSRHPGSVQALTESFRRITAERKETSRDARLALLERLAEQGSAADSALLLGALTDFDPAVGRRAAAVLEGWLGRPFDLATVQLPPPDPPPANIGDLRLTRLLFTMAPGSGGGSFELELFAGETPFTVARIVRLARAGYYNGLTFHRIAANFVAQGGSPGANEYVGDGPFMRDEPWLYTHARGTVGVSTRGRDTGDAQIFINLVDSPRLDFDYTVFARVVRGMEVVDALLEGDVIASVVVMPPAR